MAFTTPEYVIGKSDFYMGEYGSATEPGYIGDIESAKITPSQEIETITSNGIDAGTLIELPKSSKVELEFVARNSNVQMLARAMYSSVDQIAAGTATETLNLAAGEVKFLKGFNVVLTSTLVAGVDYEIDAKAGILKAITAIVDGDISYTYTTYSRLGILALQNMYFTIKIVSHTTMTKIHLFKVRLNPAAYTPVSDSLNTTTFTGSCLIDQSRVYSDPDLGKTGRIEKAPVVS